MAITTGAADAGVLNLNVGNRPRAGTAGDGDGFADALDTQMQKPRTEPRRADPRSRHEQRGQQPETQGKTGEQASARESPVAEQKPADKAKTDTDSVVETNKEPARDLVALILQATAPETDDKVKPDRVAEAQGGGAGKELPQEAANDAAVALLDATAAAATSNAGKGGADNGADNKAGMTGSQARTIDPRLAAITAPAADPAALERVDMAKGSEAQPLAPSAAKAGLAERQTEGLLQADAEVTGTELAATRNDKGDAFAATLAALRDAAPRAGSDTTGSVQVTGAAGSHVAPQASAPAAAPASAGAPPVNVPVGQQGWDHAMGERVLWMTRHGLQEAKIELHPRELGPVEVRITVQDDQANVAFTTHSPAARDALEAAMPRLREMLADSGLNLAQSDVSHRSPQQQAESGFGNGGRQESGNLLDGGAEEQPTATVATPVPLLGAVDYYA